MEYAEQLTKTGKTKKIFLICTTDEVQTIYKALDNYNKSPKAKKLKKWIFDNAPCW